MASLIYCPSCGIETASDVKFCRRCGFGLVDINRTLNSERSAQHLDKPQDASLLKRRYQAELVGNSLLVVTGGAVLTWIYHAVIMNIMVPNGAYWFGAFLLAALTSVIVAAILLAHSIISRRKTDTGTAGRPTGLQSNSETRQLRQETFLPTPSVTEHTTNLLPTNESRS